MILFEIHLYTLRLRKLSFKQQYYAAPVLDFQQRGLKIKCLVENQLSSVSVFFLRKEPFVAVLDAET